MGQEVLARGLARFAQRHGEFNANVKEESRVVHLPRKGSRVFFHPFHLDTLDQDNILCLR